MDPLFPDSRSVTTTSTSTTMTAPDEEATDGEDQGDEACSGRAARGTRCIERGARAFAL